MITETPISQKPKSATRRKNKSKKTERPKLERDRVYSPREAADALGVVRQTLARARVAGHLSAFYVGRHIKHAGWQLLEWLESGGRTA